MFVDDSLSRISRIKLVAASTKVHIDALHDVILFWIVRVLFRWDFKDCRDGLVVVLENVSNVSCNVLIDENNSNIFSGRELLEGFFDLVEWSILLDD